MGHRFNESPFLIKISFNKLLEQYKGMSKSKSQYKAARAAKILEIDSKIPQLREGFSDLALLKKYEKEIGILLEDIFPEVLTNNEIKAASVPLENVVFNPSKRFETILESAQDNYKLEITNLEENHIYILACTVILASYYQTNLQFKMPIYYDIPDKNGIMRHYRIVYNAEFMEIYPTDKAPDITEGDITELLDNFNNIELWKEKFPPHSWIAKGFVISNMFDVTQDHSISELKTKLLGYNDQGENPENFREIFQSLFNIKDIQVGYIAYEPENKLFETVNRKKIQSFLLNEKDEELCSTTLCADSCKSLLKEGKIFAISDVEKDYETSGGKWQYKRFKEQGIKSAILAPVVSDKKLLGVLELVSTRKRELNSVNANKLMAVMPYITTSILRAKNEEENMIEAVIQQECTSIHPSVKWKFEKEAKNFIRERNKGNQVSFKDIVFNDVYPLYGQIDIRDSSVARNEAIRKDLITQLELVSNIFVKAVKEDLLPIYEEYNFRIRSFLKEIREDFQTSSEQVIINFLVEEIHPALEHVKNINTELCEMVENYLNILQNSNQNVYNYRKAYDDTVMTINKKMAKILDEEQEDAQRMFPHFFERYKTDGVEHNMYIGAAISHIKKYSDVYLQNLKLWQLETMCLMENEYYNLKPSLTVPLDVASLILVHSTPLSIKYRMDEKHFDVDGTYNARYEIIKKRIDKSVIKGTKERITKPGYITIIYSQKKDEEEYMRYIKLLQAKEVLSDDINIYEIEDLQGVSGLQAISAGILYKQTDNKGLLTYDDLMKEISG
ncbi:GAF domain-containing protein [Abyssalbus ytuae]|uniref:GAF domain-containing protein n=1 Tax=Abyssalbus ytuae TaxID=2926907 RepID=A0A9E6ZYP6_9FLAO|nr:GAF domain-containing protein [Abyssalbus ytuae]UOB16311.1 GAF domain-containing protein [Abyssalbus ytuae]